MDDAQATAGKRSRPIHPRIEPHLRLNVWQDAIAFLQHDGFDEALLSYCRSMAEPSAFRWPANKIFAQKMRYLTCYMLIGLDVRFRMGLGPQPSLTDLQAVVPGSSRQVSDLIAGLRAGGYVVAERSASDGRMIALRATPALILEVARSPLAFLAALERLRPSNPPPAEQLQADPYRLASLVGHSVMHYQKQDVLFGPFGTVVDFTGRDSGYLILCAVMGCHLAQRNGWDWQLSLSYDALAQRFQVSRQHVGNVLADAAESGIFITRAGKVQSVSEAFVTEFSTWGAGQMAHYRILAEISATPNLTG
ncbi:MarR family transcriptional regulator [Rhizobium wuzhouense]|uniref:MarR family transcriptional regulator n=1 Tax=Rhizobium wuzhouense TaxID=1986026 RepID=A0ABX5NUT0_9HYPH|nr:MarR family transcriptional regulator [Rhizobium wuzhouense]PYB72479.1 MarR family transcriptional regulator [Rhizobium wuzhouense]